jgi:glycosyltransferase involved in cell wall biosynthesis
MPKLSIITVNLNNKAGLIDTAQSVVAQTWTDYEWIIIDGGSTDGSVEVIKEYADKTEKLIYWCSEPDGGIYQGMNKGIGKASGEYCWFLNSGDYAYKNTTLAEIFANEFDEDIVFGEMFFKFGHNDLRLHKYLKNIKNNKIPEYFWFGKSLPHQATFIKKECFDKYGKYKTDIGSSADWVFWVDRIVVDNVSYKRIFNKVAVFIVGNNSGIMHTRLRKEYLKTVFKKKYICLFIKHILFHGWKSVILSNKLVNKIYTKITYENKKDIFNDLEANLPC